MPPKRNTLFVPAPRRIFLRQAAVGTGALLGGPALRFAAAQQGAPAVIASDAMRPQMPSGVMSGDVTQGSAMLWSRTDRPARMMVEYAANEAMKDAVRVAGRSSTACASRASTTPRSRANR